MEVESEFEDLSPRSDLEAAFEKHDAEVGGQDEDTKEPLRPAKEESTEPAAGSKSAGEEGDPAAKAAPDNSVKEPAAKVVDPKVGPDGKPVAADPNAAAEIKPPVGWKAAEKAEWAKTPRSVQEAITRRETETAKALSLSVNSRKLADEFNQTVAPFMPLIRAQNSTPMFAVKNLLTTAAGLTVGNPEQKARIVAEMIGNFRIDIGTLDRILAGSNLPTEGAPGTNPMEVALQRQLSPVYDFMNGIKQTQAQREQQMSLEADQAVADFAEKNEFFEDVREDVADLMEMAAKRGRAMSIDQAYKVAISNDLEISGIVRQREAAAASQRRAGGSIARARNAASSVTGKPNMGGGNVKEPESRRDDLAAAWDELSQN